MNRFTLKQALGDVLKNRFAVVMLAGGLTALSPLAAQASPAISVNAWLGATAPSDPIEITINAAVSDPTGITKVDFYQGATLLGTVTSAPYTFQWNNVTSGTYTLTATVTSTSDGTASASTTIPTGGWLRIMPLGDSITQGIIGQNSFRRNLWHELRNNNYLADFVGTWAINCNNQPPPIPDFDENNQGQCGIKASEVVSTVTGYATTAQPNLVILDLGTNDLAAGQTPAQVITSLGTIIDDLRAVNPSVSIIMAQLTPTTGKYGVNIPTLNSSIVTLAGQKNTAQSPVRTVDLYSPMNLSLHFTDGLHPNNIGEQIVADTFYTGVASLLTAGSAPLITSTGFVNATVGTGIIYQIAATNSPASFGGASLPSWLTVNPSNGLVTGTATTVGTFTPTVTATNASGTGSKVITIAVIPPGVLNINALYTPGTATVNGGADAFNNGYNSSALGSTAVYKGSTFTFAPANTVDAYSNETVNLPAGTYSSLYMLGSAVGGAVTNQTVVVHYTDGTASTFTQNFSDWRTSQNYVGETIVATPSSTIGSAGQVVAGNALVYGYTFALNAKPVQSITLPATRQVIAFGFNLIGTAAPVITSSTSATGTVGATFSYQITATNSPTSYGASPLPGGLSANTSTGIISGTPNAAGTTNSTISATNAGGAGTATLVITIGASGTTAYNVSAIYTAGTAFSTGGLDSFGNAYVSSELGTSKTFNGSAFTFGSSNAADAWSNVTINLPAGTYTTLNMVGTASGGIAHAQTFVVHYTDATTQAFTLNMSDWTAATGLVGETKIVTMAHVEHSDGTTPTGNHYLSGYTLTLNGRSVQSITLPAARGVVIFGVAPVVSGPVPAITSALAQSGTAGTALSYTITATNTPTSYGASPLPGGLAVNASTGVISGTPNAAGTTNTTISATNANGTGTATLVFTIGTAAPPAPVINSSLTSAGTTGTAYSYTITATNSPTNYNATSLPTGLSVNTSTGAITGTPTVQGIYSIAISATNATGTGSANLVATIGSPATPYNVTGIYTSGSTFASATSFDSFGNSYTSSLLGASAVYNTSTFTFGPANAPDGWANTTLNLAPGTYTSLDVVGSSSGGIAASQTFTVNYNDGTNSVFTISMKDWSSSSVFAGETKVVTMPSCSHFDGTTVTGNHVLHGYTFTLTGHSVKNIVLPAARGVVILGFKGH